MTNLTLRIARMTDVDRVHLRAKGSQISAGVDKTASNRARSTKRIERAINRKALGYSAEINPGVTLAKADHLAFNQLNRVRRPCIDQRIIVALRQKSDGLKDRCDRDVEHTVRSAVKLHACLNDAEGPCVNPDRPIERFAIEPADIAFAIVKTHQSVNGRHRLECSINRTIELGAIGPGGLDLHESPEQRLCAPYFT